jgi:hypothetical protein
LDHIETKDGPRYRVKWLGWDDPNDITEEPLENLRDSEALAEYLKNPVLQKPKRGRKRKHE